MTPSDDHPAGVKKPACVDCGASISIAAHRCRQCAGRAQAAAMGKSLPADFAERAACMMLAEITAEWHVAKSTAKRWRSRAGLPPRRVPTAPAPAAVALPVLVTAEALASEGLHRATVAMYRGKAKRLRCSIEAARLLCLYGPEQLARMAA